MEAGLLHGTSPAHNAAETTSKTTSHIFIYKLKTVLLYLKDHYRNDFTIYQKMIIVGLSNIYGIANQYAALLFVRNNV